MFARPRILPLLFAAFLLVVASSADARKSKKKKDEKKGVDPYAEYVWPPPPNEPRIKLEEILSGRLDVEQTKGSRLKRILAGSEPAGPYDNLQKPIAVAFDPEGRILVTDWAARALFRFDREGHRLDVFGTQSAIRLSAPMGLEVGADGTIYVADSRERKVLAFDAEGEIVAWYGEKDELENPTDAALSPDGKKLYVVDAKAHRIAVFDAVSRELVTTFGKAGDGEREFAFPCALDLDEEGNLFVVDQINSRVQVLDPNGDYLDQFGGRATSFGGFVRPKDIAIDEVGFIYVTDFSFNNFQIFDVDFTLLTFIGSGGKGPGEFQGISGIDVQGDRIAVVEQLGHRVHVFRFIVPKRGGP